MTLREESVAKVGDLGDGQMKAVKVGETDVLLSRLNGQFYAIGATCTHQGAPLADGLLHGDTVMCPWHHSCFRVTTGECLEPPALDAEPRYTVRLDGESVIVGVDDGKGAEQGATDGKREQTRDTRVFAILGGGAAGYSAAAVLRDQGFAGRVMMITREDDLPYDRTMLSKEYLSGNADEATPLRDETYYKDHHVETVTGDEVASVDPQGRSIAFAGGKTLHYDTLLLATGGEPRALPVPGADLTNVFYLRSKHDGERLVERATQAKTAVVIGASFIGMEAAASLTNRGLKVTVVAPEAVPFEKILGAEVGNAIRKMHEEKGVTFYLGHQVDRLDGHDSVDAVILDNGERLPAELVVAGLGIKLVTSYLQGVALEKDGSVMVDRTMKVMDGLFAAGDIATFPLRGTGETARVEHWRVAEQQGKAAARGMLGIGDGYGEVPFFWSNQFDLALTYVGYATGWDEVFYWGDVSSYEFVAFYVKNGRVAAAAGNYRDRDIMAIEQLLWTDRMPGPDALRGKEQDLTALL
jgi:NADPH-dependent 2,4-dienoyl-CoA reductase/sulfur reductase-like enzyme/nitrite reductase/ring-hydroxylating ferredoxin subunit